MIAGNSSELNMWNPVLRQIVNISRYFVWILLLSKKNCKQEDDARHWLNARQVLRVLNPYLSYKFFTKTTCFMCRNWIRILYYSQVGLNSARNYMLCTLLIQLLIIFFFFLQLTIRSSWVPLEEANSEFQHSRTRTSELDIRDRHCCSWSLWIK